MIVKKIPILYHHVFLKDGTVKFDFVLCLFSLTDLCESIIAELAERSSIIIQNGSSNSNSSSRKKIWTYDRTTARPYKVLLLTCVVNCTVGTPTPRLRPVVQWSVHWAPSRTTRVLVLAGARPCALGTCGKKMRAPLFGLAKSIYKTLILDEWICQQKTTVFRWNMF